MFRKLMLLLFGLFLFSSVLVQCTGTGSTDKLPLRKVIKIKRSIVKEIKQSREIEKINLEYSYLEDPAWEKNEGQIPNPDIKYYAHVSWGYVLVTENSIWYYVVDLKEGPPEYSSVCIGRESYVGGRNFTFTPLEQIDKGKINYFIGSDPSKWVIGVERFRRLNLGEIYPGVELELEIKNGEFVKKFHIENREGLKSVRIKQEGIPKGLDTSHLEIYVNGETKEKLEYVALGEDEYVISIPQGNVSSAMTIVNEFRLSPDSQDLGFLGYSLRKSYMKLIGDEIYVAGSEGFPRLKNELGWWMYGKVMKESPFVCKFDRDLNLISKSYIVFSQGDGYSDGLAFYPGYGIYLLGFTTGKDLPLREKGYQSTLKGLEDAFVVLFSEDLKTIKASTYIGEKGSEFHNLIKVGPKGVYVAIEYSGVPPASVSLGSTKVFHRTPYVVLLDHQLKQTKGSFAFFLMNPATVSIKNLAVGKESIYVLLKGTFLSIKEFKVDRKERLSLDEDFRGKQSLYLISLSPGLKKIIAGRSVILSFGHFYPDEIILIPLTKGGVRIGIFEENFDYHLIAFPAPTGNWRGYKLPRNKGVAVLADLDSHLSIKGFLAVEIDRKIMSKLAPLITEDFLYIFSESSTDLLVVGVPINASRVYAYRFKVPFTNKNIKCSESASHVGICGNPLVYKNNLLVLGERRCYLDENETYFENKAMVVPLKVFDKRYKNKELLFSDLGEELMFLLSDLTQAASKNAVYVLANRWYVPKRVKGVYGVYFVKWMQNILLKYSF